MKGILKIVSIILISGIMASSVAIFNISAQATEESQSKNNETISETTADSNSYFYYFNKYKDSKRPLVEIKSSESKLTSGIYITESVEGKNSISLKKDKDYAEWEIDVQQTGAYIFNMTYFALEGTGRSVEVELSVDGKIPYNESANICFPRNWKDDIKTADLSFEKDSTGNELRPEQVELKNWNTASAKDVLGMYSDPYIFYLESGKHTIKITYHREPIAISEFKFYNQKKVSTYKEYLKKYSEYSKTTFEPIRQEAEKAYSKNNSSLSIGYDRSNASTLPNNPLQIRLNTIGGSNWKNCGDTISWQAKVEESGLYQISLRVRQNFTEGMNAYRTLYINGEVPFEEAKNICFEYQTDWYLKTIGNENPYYFYLEKGDIITLECTSGEMDYPLREVQQAVYNLNNIYREILMITGSSPSIYQDYELDVQIPTLKQDLMAICDSLSTASKEIVKVNGKVTSADATIEKAVKVIEELAEDTYFIPERLTNFKTNTESLASLLLTLGGQSVEIDCFYYSDGSSEIDYKVSFWDRLIFAIKRFFATFTDDYNNIGSADVNSDKTLTVWAGVGRDQAQIISRLIEERFTKQTGISVVLKLVSGEATLIKSALAGKGPEIALNVLSTTPVNMAARGALVDLTQFDLSNLEKELYPSSWVPFQYNGGVYGIAESQGVGLLFYREDIFDSLGITPPDTWEDFYDVLEILQSNNLQVAYPEINTVNQGISAAIGLFNIHLYQNGGKYYTDDLKKTMFDTEAANYAFEQTVNLYKLFGVDRDINVFNRFRSGEAPLAISSYSFYTQLLSSAPEIRGLWNIAPIPGTVKADGTIDRTQTAESTGCVMMQSAVKKGVENEAFKFMEWWCSSDAQLAYAKEIEGILGIIGRITPANRTVLQNIGWTDEEFEIIDTQITNSINIPQVIGNYQVSRSLTSAIRAAINQENSPSRALALCKIEVENEITRKREEFKLD